MTDLPSLLAFAEKAIPHDLGNAAKYARLALEIAQAHNDLPQEIEAYTLLGICAYYGAAFSDAITYLEQANQGLQSMPNDTQLARVLVTLASVYRQLGDFAIAADLFGQALDHARKSGNHRRHMSALNGLASLMSYNQKPSSALMYLEEALAIAHRTQDYHAVGVLECNMCEQYAALGDYRIALQYGETGVARLMAMDRTSEAIHGLVAIAGTYKALENFEMARTSLEQALYTARQYHIATQIPQVLALLGQLCWHFDDENTALEYLEQALNELDEKYHSDISYAHKILSEIYAKRGDFERAYTYQKRLLEWLEKSYSEENRQMVTNLEIRYKTAQAQQVAAEQAERVREIEAQRLRDQAYFHRINQIRDEFIQSASHDLKNPLARIKLSTDIIRHYGGDLSVQVLRKLDDIDHSLALMIDLISAILELLRYETGRDIERTWQHVQILIDDVALNFGEQAQTQKIDLVLEAPPEIWADYDFALLRRALHNLVGNALNYTPSGGRVHITARQQDQNLVLSVADSGRGIEEADLLHIFERFYRGKRQETEQVGESLRGTGMGLAIVKRIVENHQGSIQVESQIGLGTTFLITIPINPPSG